MTINNPWSFSSALKGFLLTFIFLLYLIFVVGKRVNPETLVILLNLTFVFVPLIYSIHIHGTKEIRDLFLFEKNNLKISLKYGVLFGFFISSLPILLGFIFNKHCTLPENIGSLFNPFYVLGYFSGLIVKIPYFVLVGLGEEYFFRYVIYYGVREKSGHIISMLITSFTFSIFHLPYLITGNMVTNNVFSYLFIFIFSCAMCLIYERYKLFTVLIIAHATCNFLIFLASNLYTL